MAKLVGWALPELGSREALSGESCWPAPSPGLSGLINIRAVNREHKTYLKGTFTTWLVPLQCVISRCHTASQSVCLNASSSFLGEEVTATSHLRKTLPPLPTPLSGQASVQRPEPVAQLEAGAVLEPDTAVDTTGIWLSPLNRKISCSLLWQPWC